MSERVSVCDRRLSGQVQQALQGLLRGGHTKANVLYILSASELTVSGLSLHLLRVLASTTLASTAAAVVGGEPPAPTRLVARLLEDKASHDVAFKLGADLVP